MVIPVAYGYREIGRLGTDGIGWPLFGALSAALVAAVFAFAARNRLRRPVVEIGDDCISYGSVFEAVRRSAKPPEVTEIVQSEPEKIVLRMRSGRDQKISLFEVPRGDRDEARQAVANAVALHVG
jgi:hypothetical protein